MKITHGFCTVAVLALLVGCSDGELILPGDRVMPRDASLPEGEATLRMSAASNASGPAAVSPVAVPISLPAAVANADWPQRGGGGTHKAPHAAFSAAPSLVWSASIGAGDSRKNRITASPVVAGGRVFTLDAEATVAATGTNGAPLWQTDLTPATDSGGDASGGGLAADGGRVYATTGFGEVIAMDAQTGAVIWRQRLDGIASGGPSVSDGLVYVATRDGSATAISATNGRIAWQIPAVASQSGVVGVSSPAFDGRLVIFPFASGQLIAVEKSSGTGLWAGQVAGRRLGRAYASITDLTGDPIIDGSSVYAGSASGRLASFSAETGQQGWTADDGAAGLFTVAGGAIFLVNDEAQLVRLDAATGESVWRVDMPYFTKAKDKRRKSIYAHYGPVLAGGRLWVASSDESLKAFDPASGAIVQQVPLPAGAASAPVVAGGTLYVVSKNGKLLAFR
ncbi:PQQ-binding-like beta-propeller repeat protein [Defluviimonas sp. WL0002]|uniref:PQQ-binding-like beta-propeller repeat protein n=1 Tax=Albidovulum marisflavi TaxID=2984159 RepID=A0ABT2ZCW6_9RHOB|nr:PQQ-binding-like beta-propeller repeat protein [Defluviimonas sp. WL0002]MCV2868959.1 PQQ-binding-like beta-propeller repeat protein [Defluviimonas sp. WL0002]